MLIPPSNLIVVENKAYVPWPLRVVPDEIVVSRRPFLLCVACEHALQTDTHAFYIVNRAPALFVEQIEADDTVGVDMWVPGYWMRLVLDEDYFGGLRRVSRCSYLMLQAIGKCMWRRNSGEWDRTSIG